MHHVEKVFFLRLILIQFLFHFFFRGKENRKFVIDTLKRRQIEKAERVREIEECVREIVCVFVCERKCVCVCEQVSISSTFFVLIFCTNVISAAFSSYILALSKNSYEKCARIINVDEIDYKREAKKSWHPLFSFSHFCPDIRTKHL